MKNHRFVEQSLGNIDRPLTNRQMNDKFRDQAVMALPAEQVKRDPLAPRIDQLADLGRIGSTGMRKLTLIAWLAAVLSVTAQAEVSELRFPIGAGGVGCRLCSSCRSTG